jgi:hypothetical protein
MRSGVARAVWLLVGLLAGCRAPVDDEDARPASPRPIAKIGHGEIDVIVNGDKLAILSQHQLRAGVRIDELLANHPYVSWTSITAYGPGGGPFEWLEPVTNYAGSVPLAFLDGDRGALALIDPARPDARETRFDGIDEIRITVPKPPRTPLEALADGCRPPPKGEVIPTPTAKRWRGTSFQFNIPMHWRSDFTINFSELVDKPIGAKVGTIVGSAVEWEQVCRADLYRIADRNGRRAVVGRVRPGNLCVDAIMEFACDGTAMRQWAYYADSGQYVEHGTLYPVP